MKQRAQRETPPKQPWGRDEEARGGWSGADNDPIAELDGMVDRRQHQMGRPMLVPPQGRVLDPAEKLIRRLIVALETRGIVRACFAANPRALPCLLAFYLASLLGRSGVILNMLCCCRDMPMPRPCHASQPGPRFSGVDSQQEGIFSSHSKRLVQSRAGDLQALDWCRMSVGADPLSPVGLCKPISCRVMSCHVKSCHGWLSVPLPARLAVGERASV